MPSSGAAVGGAGTDGTANDVTCTMRFSISEAQKSAVLIPAGTRITDTNKTLVWVTAEDNYSVNLAPLLNPST